MSAGADGDVRIVRIVDLARHPELADLLAGWHVDEFGDLYEPSVWNLDIARRELAEMAAGGGMPSTWLAFDGDGRGADDLLGSVSLVATDDLPGFEHVTPWLASLYVVPSARGRGVGSELVRCVLDAALRLGYGHVHLFSAGQERYYLERGWRTVEHVDVRGRAAAVMRRSTWPTGARRTVCSRWSTDPDVDGAYSYVRAGATPDERDVLAGPILDGLWLAGEATWREHPGTMHGAWFSGERAARMVGEARTVVVVGAGLAGLAAARTLHAQGTRVVVLEAADRAGGRAATDTSLGIPLPLGGAWLHGDEGHPLATLVTSVPDDWSDDVTYLTGHGAVGEADLAAARAARAAVDVALARAAEHACVADVVERVLGSLELTPAAAAVARAWVRSEYENLYAAPLGDVSARHGAEPYELPGGNRFITSSLTPALDALAEGLDVRLGHRVGRLTRVRDGWTTDTGLTADAVVVTVPIGALRAGRVAFDPPLPARVATAIDRLGAGPVAKLFATYDERWWAFRRAARVAGRSPFTVVVDVTDLTGTPVLCWFAVGADARRIETMNDDARCELVDAAARDLRLDGVDAAT